MRVTNNMVADQVVFNMQRSISRFLRLQNQMSTGRRLNTPSDDPIGVQRDLTYRTELAKNAQYQKNIHQAQSWTQNYDSVLADLKDLVSSANEIAVAMANGTYDAVTRAGSAEEVASIFERMVQLANSQLEGRHVFSGFRTHLKALAASSDGVEYAGDTGQIEFQIESSQRSTVNLIGSEVFLKQLSILGEHADLNVGVTGATLLADLHGGDGLNLSPGTFTITDENMGITSTVDVGGAVTVDDAITAINNQLAADGITNLEAKLGGAGNNILMDTTQNGLISVNTALEQLNHGNGVDREPGKFRVTDGSGIDIEIDLSGAKTIGDVISTFNSQMASSSLPMVTMSINPAGTGLQIFDGTGALGLRTEEIHPEESTALELGLLGPIAPTLVGTDLEPAVKFEIADTTGTIAAELGIAATFSGDLSGEDLDPMLLLTANLAELNNNLGLTAGQLVLHQGSETRIVDLTSSTLVTVQDVLDAINGCGLDITASLNADQRGIQVVNNDPTASFIIEDTPAGRAAKEFQLWGSSDMLGSMLLLQNALETDDQEGTGRLLENMHDAIDHLLNHRAAVGSRGVMLESTLGRLLDMETSFTKLLSEVEDADITKLVADLAAYESNYQASLLASARIMQPSLLDFLR